MLGLGMYASRKVSRLLVAVISLSTGGTSTVSE